MQNYLPDPFIFCAILTFVVFALVMPITGQSPVQVVDAFAGSFWNLLSFSMQMALVVLAGHAMAATKAFKRMLANLASMVHKPDSAIFLVSIVSAIASWVNWGFGLVLGAIFAKELASRVQGADYRLLIAAAYSGFLFWHGGLSASIPLALASGNNLSMVTGGAIHTPISIQETIFSPLNITIIVALLVTIPLLNRFMHPDKSHSLTIPEHLLDAVVVEKPLLKPKTLAEKLENSRWINVLLATLGFIYIISYFVRNGFALNLNIVNFLFLFTAIALHRTPKQFLAAVAEGTKSTAGILL